MPEKIIFITGGARSGKSRLAEKLAESNGGQVAYVATAGVLDSEMAERVKIHQERRPAGWLTIEEPLSLTSSLTRVPATVSFVIVDCLTLWLTNRLLQEWDTVDMAVLEKEILLELALFMDQLPSTPFRIAIVTNEVGCGIVPESALARAFRDLAGRANQMVAARADTVYLTVSGLPLKLKGGA